MKWLMEFYNERRGIVARYRVEAPLPGAAVLSGRQALRAEYPATPRKGRPSLFQQAERIGGQDPSEWVLYRIARDDGSDRAGQRCTPSVAPDDSTPR